MGNSERLGKATSTQSGAPSAACQPPRRPPGREICIGAILAVVAPAASLLGQTPQSTEALANAPSSASARSASLPLRPLDGADQADRIWLNGVGSGFRSGAQTVNLSLGANLGMEMLGGRESHHLALTSLSYGKMLGPLFGEGSWFRGNWELRAELFGGAEFLPESEWLVGFAPHLRYHLTTGTRWVPFVDVGAGVSATSIGPPDLSGTFEFNLQGGLGTHWFLRDHLAISVEAHFLHLSCAGINSPNLGLNGVTATLGLTWFF